MLLPFCFISIHIKFRCTLSLEYQQPFQLHQPRVQQHHQHPVHVHQASEPVHAGHAQIPMLSNHSQRYVGGTDGQFQFQK